jgi:hypothetical protein
MFVNRQDEFFPHIARRVTRPRREKRRKWKVGCRAGGQAILGAGMSGFPCSGVPRSACPLSFPASPQVTSPAPCRVVPVLDDSGTSVVLKDVKARVTSCSPLPTRGEPVLGPSSRCRGCTTTCRSCADERTSNCRCRSSCRIHRRPHMFR